MLLLIASYTGKLKPARPQSRSDTNDYIHFSLCASANLATFLIGEAKTVATITRLEDFAKQGKVLAVLSAY